MDFPDVESSLKELSLRVRFRFFTCGFMNPCTFLRGVGAGCNTKEVIDRLRYLEAEIEDLELKEKELDQQKLWLQQSIKNVMDDSTNNQYPFKLILCIMELELKQQLKHR